MDLYDEVSRKAARQLTLAYSTSFGMASRLFSPSIRNDIYCIYGLVRIADEIVDTYRGDGADTLLAGLEQQTYDAMDRGYSPDIIVHAFAGVARRYGIGENLVRAFFASMAMDLRPGRYDRKKYERYIYGSAEVIGLMCLRVFCDGDKARYDNLAVGARALGAAYQKVNFLRDLADDRGRLGRNYFPELQDEGLTETTKAAIVKDIDHDFSVAHGYIGELPPTARAAVRTSYRYYAELLAKLRRTPAEEIGRRRIRIGNRRKTVLLGAAVIAGGLRR